MKKTLYSILLVLLVLIISMSLLACKEPNFDEPEEGETEETAARSQLITNGTFYSISNTTGSTNYVKENVDDWAVTTGSLTKSSEGVVFGGIDLSDKDTFENAESAFSINKTMEYPGVDTNTPVEKDDATKLQDTNALLLGSTKTAGSIYYKNSSDFTLAANTYYKLQFSVLTDIDLTGVPDGEKDSKGAWVIIDGAVYAEFSCINTEGSWKKYEVYIEGSNFDATRTIKVRLWFGHGPEEINDVANVYLTKGAALFDNIICKVITEDDYDAAQNAETVKKTTMVYPDMAMEQQSELSVSSSPDYFYSFRSGSNSSSNATNYTLVEGKTGLTTNKPTVDKPYVGIVDMSKMYRYDSSKEGEAKYINTYSTDHSKTTFYAPDREDFMTDEGIFKLNDTREIAANDKEHKSLMIYHDDLSGAGYKSNKQLLIKKGTYYTIKVWAYVWSIDLPTPSTSSIGSEPTAPTTARPEEAAFNTAEAEYNYTLSSEAQAALTDTQKANIAAIPADRKAAIDAMENKADLKDAYDAIVELKAKWTKYDTDSAKYTEDYNEYMEKYYQWRDANSHAEGEEAYVFDPYAEFRLTGAGDLDAVKTTKVGEWEELTFYINGNQLSDRKVNLEFWFGEGSKTDYTSLMMGGVLFDNIEIAESLAPEAGKSYEELTPFTDEDITSGNIDIGGLIDYTGVVKFNDDETLTDNDLWEKELVDGVAEADSALLDAQIKADTSFPIIINDVTKNYNLLQMINTDYTASILTYRGEREILANKCYRLSFWAKTADIDDKLGATLALYSKESGSADDMASVSSVTTFNNEEWQEVVFYIKGDTLENNLVSLKFTLGSGTRFNTASYIKGALYLSAITLKEIEYSEYSATTKSGDQTKSYAFTNTATSSSDSVTNSNFGTIDLADIDEDAIDENGKLVGIAPTSSWTTPDTATSNSFNKPTIKIEEIENVKYLVWKNVVDANGDAPAGYEVYIENTVDAEDEDVESLYIGYADTHYKTVGEGDAIEYWYRCEIKSSAKGNFMVRAVSSSGVGTKSDTVANTVSTGDAVFTEYTVTPKKEFKIGTINYKDYNSGVYATLFEGSDYVSPYDTMLILTSNYGIRASVTAASKSLSASTYYEVSVWVKTLGDAKASITFDDISDVLETKDATNYIGYVNQDTDGAWVQYRFYIATDTQSSSMELMLSIGNPYAKGTNGTETKATKMYGTDALSTGTIFFDNVNIVTLTEDEYTEKTAVTVKNEENEDVSAEYYIGNEVFLPYEMVYTNEYAFKVLTYSIDSFDSFTENTVTEEFDDEGDYEEGYNRGDTPNAYTWAKATDGQTTDAARLYGVYSYLDIDSNTHPLMTNATNVDPFSGFLPSGFDLATFIKGTGNNALVMSNLVANGQNYTLTTSNSLSAESYYKITFQAKTLLPAGKYAEFRYMYDAETDNYTVIKITSEGKAYDELVEYTMYVHNSDDATKSIKWAFSLGGDAEDEKVVGMLVIDNVKFVAIDAEEYTAAKTSYETITDETLKTANPVQLYLYETDSTSGEDEETPDEETPEESIFDKGEIWLLVSSIVIAVIIIAVVIAVVVKKVKKKHPKKVKGENIVKTEKTIEVTPISHSDKEDVINEEEFIDKEEKPKYIQRVLPKKKKK